MEPVTEACMHVIGQIDCEEGARRRRVIRHVVCGVVKEFGSCVSFDIMRVVITPPKLDVDPVLCRDSPIVGVLLLVQ